MSATPEWLSRAGFAAMAGVVLAAGATAATAADRDPFAGAAPRAIAIHASQADLASPARARALAIRIRAAASTVCGGDVDPVVRTSDLFAKCREAAIDHALSALNAPVLAQALGRSPEQLASDPR